VIEDAEVLCRTCGHAEGTHLHYRVGTDCAAPGCDCPHFVWPRTWLGRLLDRVLW
jgi:hypothetical protein